MRWININIGYIETILLAHSAKIYSLININIGYIETRGTPCPPSSM